MKFSVFICCNHERNNLKWFPTSDATRSLTKYEFLFVNQESGKSDSLIKAMIGHRRRSYDVNKSSPVISETSFIIYKMID